jgi:SagB-type dehydrogenase family enzyme
MDNKLEMMFAPAGVRPPAEDMAALLEFHERTKATPEADYFLFDNIYQYLFEYRGRAETAANRKNYMGRMQKPLPPPHPITMPLGEAIAARRSTRDFDPSPLDMATLSNMLATLAANRPVTIDADAELVLSCRGYPSPGGLFPSEIYVALSNVEGEQARVCHYDPHNHALTDLATIEPERLFDALGDRGVTKMRNAAVHIFVTSLFERVAVKYGTIGYRFALIETGLILQQLGLAAAALGLGGLAYGGYFDEEVNAILDIDGMTETTVGCMFVGHMEKTAT